MPLKFAEVVSYKKINSILAVLSKKDFNAAGFFSRKPVGSNVVSQQLFYFQIVLTQLTFTYSKSTIETLEKSMN